jgi:hypothetical protein
MGNPLYNIGQVITYRNTPIKITDVVKVEHTILGNEEYYWSYEFVEQTPKTKKWSVKKKIQCEYFLTNNFK